MTPPDPEPEHDPLLPYLPPEVLADLSPAQWREWADLRHRVRQVREHLHTLTVEMDKLALAIARQGNHAEPAEQDRATDSAMFLAMHADSMRALLADDLHAALDISRSADKYAVPR